jgi:hypothetical protein
MLIPRRLIQSPLLQQRLPLLCNCTIKPLSASPILSLLRTKCTVNQILRGCRIPPRYKRVKKPEAPDLKQSPFKKAVVQKVFIVKPKVPTILSQYKSLDNPYSASCSLSCSLFWFSPGIQGLQTDGRNPIRRRGRSRR